MTDVRQQAQDLRSYAEHFVQEDWNYTRDTGDLVRIKYDYPEDRFWGRKGRLSSSLWWLFRNPPPWMQGWGPNRFVMAWYVLKRDRHIPDGVLDKGCIITFWEEMGEYLQYVQPSVGSIIADFMENDPEHPYALLLAREMERIQESYAARLAEKEVERKENHATSA